MPEPVLIGVDWGSSNLRVMAIMDTGELLEQRTDPRGASGLTGDLFSRVLSEVCGDWIATGLPVIVCGMAGSRGRWLEIGYCACPAGLADIAQAVEKSRDDAQVRIVPGVALMAERGLFDVMRGEETQVMGLFDDQTSGLVCAPGTHSKWIEVRQGVIVGLRTFVTGEMFGALCGTSLIIEPADAEEDLVAFETGLTRGLAGGGIMSALFSTRVEVLSGRLQQASATDYLSGLIIGAEVLEVKAQFASEAKIKLVGANALIERYRCTLAAAGFRYVETVEASRATAKGLWRIWKATHS